MKILVYGAGVLGCNLARNLFRAGKDAALLARGSWAEELQTNGLRIKDTFSPRMSVSRIPVVTALKPEDPYDVIFAAVRYTQIASVMDTLRASRAKTIIFVGNNARRGNGGASAVFLYVYAVILTVSDSISTPRRIQKRTCRRTPRQVL